VKVINVLIADDHSLVRQGLKQILELEKDIRIVGQAGDGEEAITKVQQLKPDVVLYEEGLDADVMYGAIDAIARADVLIIGGTSLAVYPAAGLIDVYKGDNLVVINRDRTPADLRADLVICGSIGEILGQVEI